MKKVAAGIILAGTLLAVSGTMAIRHGWEEARKAEQTKAGTVIPLPDQEREESTLVMLYPDGTSVELTGTVRVLPRGDKWYVEFREE